jgi:hypothetical protein
MTRSKSGFHCGWQVSLPPVVEGLLLDVVADGFVLYCCGDRAAPNALVASYEWDHCVDLVTIRDFERVTAARMPRKGKVDIFAPEVVVWAYEGPPQQALRALLNLVHPAHPDAPTIEYPAPPGLHIPRAQQRPMTIRLPSPDRAAVRAVRLATEITAHGDDSVIATCPRVAESLSEVAPETAPEAAGALLAPSTVA